jgi:hypothetical protein
MLAEDDRRRVVELAERIRRQSVRLNETTLIIDAQLADTHPQTAAVEAQRSFDAELALSNCARFAVALAVKVAPPAVRGPATAALSALHDDDPAMVSDAVTALRALPRGEDRVAVPASRLAASVEQYAHARDRLRNPIDDDEIRAAGGGFTPAVQLAGAWLPGSTPINTEASITRGRALLDRATMASYLRTSIQIAVAGTMAVIAGYAVSAPRVYWAILTVFVCFLQATNAGEQVRRALFRATGTAIGIVLGGLLVHLTGGRVWASVAIVLVSMFFGIYLIRVNYTFLSIAITVMIAQLYVQLGEFGWQVLLLRLAETAVGVAAVIVTVLFIVPLRPQRVLIIGVLQWIRALRTLLDAVLDRLDGKYQPLRPWSARSTPPTPPWSPPPRRCDESPSVAHPPRSPRSLRSRRLPANTPAHSPQRSRTLRPPTPTGAAPTTRRGAPRPTNCAPRSRELKTASPLASTAPTCDRHPYSHSPSTTCDRGRHRRRTRCTTSPSWTEPWPGWRSHSRWTSPIATPAKEPPEHQARQARDPADRARVYKIGTTPASVRPGPVDAATRRPGSGDRLGVDRLKRGPAPAAARVRARMGGDVRGVCGRRSGRSSPRRPSLDPDGGDA